MSYHRPHPPSPVPNSLSHGSYSPSQLGSHGGRSPVSSPTPQTPSLPLGSSALHMGYPSPGNPTPAAGGGGLNTSGNDGGVSSDCSDDEGSPGGGGGGGHMPVVYPWMKKIHVAGQGEIFPSISIWVMRG